MKIIVTGGAGFIGSHVVDAYAAAGHRIVIIDNLSSGSRKNINPRAKFYEADIRDKRAIEGIFRKERPEVVNHHAAFIQVVKSFLDPMRTLDINVLGTVNLLLNFAAHGKGKERRKFIFASTGGAIYGEPKHFPADEKTPPDPLSPYGLSKLMAEKAVIYYARQSKFAYTIFRYANVYGPRQNPKTGIVPIFGTLMKHGLRPTIFGDGSKARDYISALDIARANTLALRCNTDEILNLGWGKMATDKMMYDTIAKEIGFEHIAKRKHISASPIYAPLRKGEVYQISLDARRAKKILGFTPKVTLKDGIHEAMKAL